MELFPICFWCFVVILFYSCWRLACASGFCLLLVTLVGCSSLGVRTRHAAAVAASDPWTWAPLTGAAVIAATNSDEGISRWAQRETPVFGSPEAAIAASDRFRQISSSSAWGIFLAATPQGGGNWLGVKGERASENLVGLALARSTTGLLKHTVQRERPNGNPVHDSFPSAHSTDAFAHASLARNYNGHLQVYSPMREGMQWASNGFAFATAWGRVEGGAHYPSDVLIGAAIANFTTRFFMQLVPASGKFDWRVRTRTNEFGMVVISIEKPL